MQRLRRWLKISVLNLLHRLLGFLAEDITGAPETGPSLIIAPISGSETLGCGATIARAIGAGQEVKVLVVTFNREKSFAEERSSYWKTEILQTLSLLGCQPEDALFLELDDSAAANTINQIAVKIEEQIVRFNPRQIFMPFGAGIPGNHRPIASAIDLLIRKSAINSLIYEYLLWFSPFYATRHLLSPQQIMRLRKINAEEFLAVKKAAVAELKAQCENAGHAASWFIRSVKASNKMCPPCELFFEKRSKIT